MPTRDDILTELEDQIRALTEDVTYDQDINHVVRFWPSIHDRPDHEFPMIVVDDGGNEPGPEYLGKARFKTFLNISGIVRGNTDEELTTKVEKIGDALNTFLYSDPTLHAQAMNLKVVAKEDQGVYSRSSRSFASVMLRVRILWWDTVKTVAAGAGTDVYGTQWLDAARDKLVARINTLKTTMASGYSPTFSYVHERHVIPNLFLNAVSVGVESEGEGEFSGGSAGVGVTHDPVFSVRVHTAYDDDFHDDQETGRLINSLINQVRAQIDLGDGYRVHEISEINTNAVFDESESRGGEFLVTIKTSIQHTQE